MAAKSMRGVFTPHWGYASTFGIDGGGAGKGRIPTERDVLKFEGRRDDDDATSKFLNGKPGGKSRSEAEMDGRRFRNL